MTTTEQLKVVITAENKTKKAFDEVGKSSNLLQKDVSNLTNALGIGLVGAFVGAVAYGKKAIAAFQDEEKAIARLEATSRNVLVTFQGFEAGSEELNTELKRVTASLHEQASALQRVTTFADEQIISSQSMLSTFALSESQIKKLTPAILDMAASMEKAGGGTADLESISIAVGKALTNGVGSLSRYGVVVSATAEAAFELADANEKVNIIVGELDKNFKGIAETVGQTTAGKMIQLQNAMSDLNEIFGKALAEGLMPFVETLTKWTSDPKNVEQITRLAESIGVGLKNAFEITTLAMEGFHIMFDGLTGAFVKILDFLDSVERAANRVSSAISKVTGGSSKSSISGASVGSTKKVKDAIITPRGDVIETDPADYIIATKNPAGMGGKGVVVNIYNPMMLDSKMVQLVSDQIVGLLKREVRL